MAHEAHGGSDRQNIIVWGRLLALTGIRSVACVHTGSNLTLMLIILMGASIIKGGADRGVLHALEVREAEPDPDDRADAGRAALPVCYILPGQLPVAQFETGRAGAPGRARRLAMKIASQTLDYSDDRAGHRCCSALESELCAMRDVQGGD